MFQLRPSTGLAARRPAERQSNPPASQTSTASSVRSSACLRSNTSRRSRTRRPRARAPRPVRAEGPPLFGELEHYDLDMDEILDVPYIKSAAAAAKESLLSPVSWPDLRKPKPADQDSPPGSERSCIRAGRTSVRRRSERLPSPAEAGQALENVWRSRRGKTRRRRTS